MRHLAVFLLFILFASIMEASYLRSLRVASFPTQNSADSSRTTLNKFLSNSDAISELQQTNDFETKIIKAGTYYLLVVEPIRDPKTTQKMLDLLRVKYKDVYPKKIKETPKPVQKKQKVVLKETKQEFVESVEVKDEKELQDKAELQLIENEKLEKEQKEQEQRKKDKKEKQKAQKEQIEKETVKHRVVEKKIPKVSIQKSVATEDNLYYYQILLGLVTFILLVLTLLLISLRRKNETYINKNTINEEKLKYFKTQRKNREVVITHVSHELRAPIRAIAELTNLVLEGELSEEQNNNMLRIENSSQHLLSIVNDILDVSKIQAGKLKIEKQEFNINGVIDYVFNISSIQAKNNNTVLILDMETDVPPNIIGDSLRLGQVLINVLGNAVKFTKDGEIIVGVKKLSTFEDSIKLEFTVSDTGIGMSEAQMKNAFDSYAQAEESTSREFGGTGLGLSITKNLVEMMNGEVKIQSKVDVGTTFTFTILFKLKDSHNQRHYRLPSATLLNKKVLIVDAKVKNVLALNNALEYFKYETRIIPSFEDVPLENNLSYDIIIINESRLSKVAVETISKFSKVKVVILSDLNSNTYNSFIDDINVDAYLKIPFTQQKILNMITELYISKNSENRIKKTNLRDEMKEMSGKRVLAVEDNKLNHKVISGLFANSGIELTFVLDGKAAVDTVHAEPMFDLILMDINMPIMNGYEATVEIRKDKKYDKVPILALSADIMEESIKKVFIVGMQGHIAKPIMIDVFYKKILDALRNPDVNIFKSVAKEKKQDKIIDKLQELSVSTGIGRCNGDVEFYKSILMDFKLMYADSPQTINNLCQKSKFKEARRMVTDIKDVALNIGAYNLCESASTLEFEFEKGSRSRYDKPMKLYKTELDKLFLDIDKYLE